MDIIKISQKNSKSIGPIAITSAQLIELINLSSENIEDQIKLAKKQIEGMKKIIQEYQPIAEEYYSEIEKMEAKIKELQKKCREILLKEEKDSGSSENSKTKKDKERKDNYGNYTNSIYLDIAKKNRKRIEQKLQERIQEVEKIKNTQKDDSQTSVEKIVYNGILSQIPKKTEQMIELESRDIKKIRRKIAPVLHPDRIESQVEVNVDKRYLLFLREIFQELQLLYSKKDKDAIILVIENNNIMYKNNRFIIPNVEYFRENEMRINKKKELKILHQDIHQTEHSPVFLFYKAYNNTGIKKQLETITSVIEETEVTIEEYTKSHLRGNNVTCNKEC